MSRKRANSLRGLIRRLIFSFSLTLMGSWGLLLTRLHFPELQAELARRSVSQFYLDLAGLSLTFLGLFMALYYHRRLLPRLQRMEQLGEDRW